MSELNPTWAVVALFAYLSVKEVALAISRWAYWKYSWGEDDPVVVQLAEKEESGRE